MGNACGGDGVDSGDPAAKASSEAIDKELEEAERKAGVHIKILLLGTGDAGKSTFAKQMTVLHSSGFSNDDYARFRKVLRDNCLTSMQKIVGAMQDAQPPLIAKLDKAAQEAATAVVAADELMPAIAAHVGTLSAQKRVQKFIVDKATELQLPSSTAYFFEHAARFAQPQYEPTQDDMLRARVPTIGVRETQFAVKGKSFTMVDVGGQRSERRKWLHCFQGVNAVIYLAALDEYDKTLEEDRRTNRMLESLNLYEQLSGLKWFIDTPFILFLNKCDLFKEKIKKRPLHAYFQGVDEAIGGDYEKGVEFVQQKYEEAFHGHAMYPFVTCALDTENCGRVFSSVKDNVLFQRLDAEFS